MISTYRGHRQWTHILQSHELCWSKNNPCNWQTWFFQLHNVLFTTHKHEGPHNFVSFYWSTLILKDFNYESQSFDCDKFMQIKWLFGDVTLFQGFL